jgi:hypothetical protein
MLPGFGVSPKLPSIRSPKNGGQRVEKRQSVVSQNANDHASREEERSIRRRNVSQI